MNIKEELLIKQAQEGYTVCYIESCPLRDHCLRWLVGQHLPNPYLHKRHAQTCGE